MNRAIRILSWRRLTFPAAVFLLCLSLGCGGGEKGERGYLRLRLAEDPTTLDPALIVDVPGGALAAKIFNGLVRFDRDGNLEPDLAESWEILPDGVTYRFRLRDNARFSSGTPLEAEDAVFSLRRLLDPAVNSPRSWLLESVRGAKEFARGETGDLPGIRAPAPRIVEIELEAPLAVFLDYLAMPNAAVLPRAKVRESGREFGRCPEGAGPFRLRSWRPGDRLVLERNENYFRGPAGLPGVVYRVIPEDLTAATEFEAGNLDVLEIPRGVFESYLSVPPPGVRVESRPGLNVYYAGFNCARKPFDDPRVRQALNLALDRDLICRNFLSGRAVPARGPVPPGLLEDPELEPYEYSPLQARRLLEEAGTALPLRARLLVAAERENVGVAEVLQDYWKRAGIEVEIAQREWSAFKEQLNDGDFDIFYLSWWGDYPDAENFLYPTFFSGNRGAGGNRSFFADGETDRLLSEALARIDREGRGELYRLAQRRVVELAPWVFLWHRKIYLALGPAVSGYRIPLIYSADNLEGVSLSREER